jgi:hypothetical protein
MKIFAFALLAGAALAPAASFITFQVPNCPGGTQATDINDRGVIVGTSGCGGFIRDPFGHFTLLPHLFPNAINIHGAITGEQDLNIDQGFVRSPTGVVTTFSADPGHGATFPVAINALGQVVGTFYTGRRQAFLRQPDGTIVFSSFPDESQATSISDLGDIVGAKIFSGIPQSFLRSPSGMVTIVGPMIPSPSVPDDWATSINRTGTAWLGIANTFNLTTLKTESHGYIQTGPTATPRLFLLTYPVSNFPPFGQRIGGGINASRAAAIQNLYIAPNGSISQIDLGTCGDVSAQAINDSGWVTGSCTVPGQPSSGFLWRK